MLKTPDAIALQAMSPLEREEFVRMAIRRGVPLARVEEYLDWLDAAQAAAEAQGGEEESTLPP